MVSIGVTTTDGLCPRFSLKTNFKFLFITITNVFYIYTKTEDFRKFILILKVGKMFRLYNLFSNLF